MAYRVFLDLSGLLVNRYSFFFFKKKKSKKSGEEKNVFKRGICFLRGDLFFKKKTTLNDVGFFKRAKQRKASYRANLVDLVILNVCLF